MSKELEDKDFEDKELQAKFERYLKKREAEKRVEELKAQQPLIDYSFVANENIEEFIECNRDESRLREIVNLRIFRADLDKDIKSMFLKLLDTHSFVKHTKLELQRSPEGNCFYGKKKVNKE